MAIDPTTCAVHPQIVAGLGRLDQRSIEQSKDLARLDERSTAQSEDLTYIRQRVDSLFDKSGNLKSRVLRIEGRLSRPIIAGATAGGMIAALVEIFKVLTGKF